MNQDEADEHEKWLDLYMQDGASITRCSKFDDAIKASMRLLKREPLIVGLLSAVDELVEEAQRLHEMNWDDRVGSSPFPANTEIEQARDITKRVREAMT